MATTAYLAGTDSNDLEMSYAPETTWGTSPTGSGAYTKFRVNTEGFSEQKNRTRPPELRSDWQSAAATTQDLQARGNLQFGISYQNMDWAIAGLLTGAWTSDLNIAGSSGDISAVASGNKLTSTTTGKFADVVVGQWIKLAGFSTAGNNGFARVSAKADDEEITLTGLTLTDETPSGSAVSIKGSMLRNAKVFTSFSIQKRLSSSLGFIYPGTFFIGGQLNAARGQFFSGTLDALCKNETKAASEVGSNPVAAPTNKVMNTVGHFKSLDIDGSASTAKIMSVNTTLVRDSTSLAFALGSESAQGLGSVGSLNVGFTTEIFFEDYDLYDAYKAETEKEFSYRVQDTAGNAYIVTIPVAVLGNSEIIVGGPNQPVMARFTAMADPSSTYSSTIQLDRFAA